MILKSTHYDSTDVFQIIKNLLLQLWYPSNFNDLVFNLEWGIRFTYYNIFYSSNLLENSKFLNTF